MTDRTAACITISGLLPLVMLDELIGLVEDESLAFDYEGTDDIGAEIRLFLANNSGPLILMANEVAGGQFQQLEHFCRDNNLTYSRGDDGHYTWTPAVVYWEPGLQAPREWAGSVDDHVPHLSAAQIKTLAATGALDDELALMARANELTSSFSVSSPEPAQSP